MNRKKENDQQSKQATPLGRLQLDNLITLKGAGERVAKKTSIAPKGSKIFYENQTEYKCFCVNDIYLKLFDGFKPHTACVLQTALISFDEKKHEIKKNKELLKFLLPPALFEKIEKYKKNGKIYLKNHDYKEFLLKSSNNNRIAKLLFEMFSPTEKNFEKKFIIDIQKHFIEMLKSAKFRQPELNDFLCDLVDGCIAPPGSNEDANTVFHNLINSGDHNNISKAIANIFISAMLGLYSMRYSKPEAKRNFYVLKTYILSKLGKKFIWIPETISNKYIQLQDALNSYEVGHYCDSYKKSLMWLAEHESTANNREFATVFYILGACLTSHPEECKSDGITKSVLLKLQKYIPSLPSKENESITLNFEKKNEMRFDGISLLKKSISTDSPIPEAYFILYSQCQYINEDKQKASDYLTSAFTQSYVKAIIEVARHTIKGENQSLSLTCDDIIDKLTLVISNQQNYSVVDVSECLYLRGQLRLQLCSDSSGAMTDFKAASQKGHENARQELSRKERIERRRFPSFSDNPTAPCCFANSLSGNNLMFLSTLPDGEWRLFATEKNIKIANNAESVNDFDEFIDIQVAENFESYTNKILFLFMSTDEDCNLNECLMTLDNLFNIALTMSENQKNLLIDNIEIFVCANYEIASTLIDANINDMGSNIYFKVHIIDEARDSAHQLLCDAPLFLPLLPKPKYDNSINVVLFGCSETNYQIIKESIGCAYLGEDYPINITMLGTDADRMERRFHRECPGFFHKPDISCIKPKFIPCCIQEEDFPSLIYGSEEENTVNNELSSILKVGNYFVVDLSSDQYSIKFAMDLRTWFLRSGGEFNRTPFICIKCRNAQNSYLASHLTLSGQAAGDTYYSKYDLFPFGITRILYSYNRLVENPRLEEVALQIHKSYYGDNERQAENDYYSFSYNADSSLLTAIGLSYRLFAGGAYMTQKEAYLNYGAFDMVNLPDILNEYIESLSSKDKEEFAAALEQSRWNGFMLSRGWESADLNRVEKYKEQSTGSSHKHTLAKLHPFIREWKDLDSDDIEKIMKMLKSKYDYSKHPISTTIKSIRDTPRFLVKPDKENGITR